MLCSSPWRGAQSQNVLQSLGGEGGGVHLAVPRALQQGGTGNPMMHMAIP